MWKRAAYYGVFLAAGTLALQWLDYQRLARAHSNDIYILLVALAFLALGLSPRELTVLHELAAGRSNKEIAALLDVSPNTIKTHVSRVLEKLDANRRTEAIRKARELGIVP